MQGPFMEAAQMAADEANALDRDLEDSFKARLMEAVMEIYTPSAAEADQWRSAGESVWETAGGEIDRSVIERMVAAALTWRRTFLRRDARAGRGEVAGARCNCHRHSHGMKPLERLVDAIEALARLAVLGLTLLVLGFPIAFGCYAARKTLPAIVRGRQPGCATTRREAHFIASAQEAMKIQSALVAPYAH